MRVSLGGDRSEFDAECDGAANVQGEGVAGAGGLD